MATQFGLFGPTPEQLRMAEQARREQTFAQQAQGMGAFGPLYQISRGLTSQGINTLGQALFPQAQSPQLQQATALQALKQQYAGVDLSNPNNLMKLATDLSSVGAVDQAMQVATQARTIQENQQKLQAEITLKEAQAEKARKDRPEQTLKPISADLGDRIEILDPYSGATIRVIPKALSPTAQQRLEEGQVREGFNAKTGSYTNSYGEVFDRTEMRLNRQGFEEAQKLLQKLNTITAEDVKQSESLIDYTEPGVTKSVGQQVAPKTVNAQVKIAASQLLEQIAKLPPGSASDADMRAAVRDFPGYGNADNLADWVNRTKADLSASLARQQDTYGFRRQVEATPALELSTSRRQGRSGRAAAAQQPQQPVPATAGRGVPADVDPAVWSVMTEEEKALWR